MHVEIGEVRRALENNELEPFFQPLVELRNGRLTGFEVLTRWQHPEFGFVLPENFISLVEDHGLIGLLTEQILRKALSSAMLLPDPLTLAVNVSPSQLQDLSLPRPDSGHGSEGKIFTSTLDSRNYRERASWRSESSKGCRPRTESYGL